MYAPVVKKDTREGMPHYATVPNVQESSPKSSNTNVGNVATRTKQSRDCRSMSGTNTPQLEIKEERKAPEELFRMPGREKYLQKKRRKKC